MDQRLQRAALPAIEPVAAKQGNSCGSDMLRARGERSGKAGTASAALVFRYRGPVDFGVGAPEPFAEVEKQVTIEIDVEHSPTPCWRRAGLCTIGARYIIFASSLVGLSASQLTK